MGRGGRICVAPWPCHSPAHQNTSIFPLVTAQNMRLSFQPVSSAWDTANPNTWEAEEAGSLFCPRRTELGCQCCLWQDSAGALGVIREPQFCSANRDAAPCAMMQGVFCSSSGRTLQREVSAVNTGSCWPGLPFEQDSNVLCFSLFSLLF